MILPCLHLHFYHPHLSHQNVSLLVFLYSYSSRVMFKTFNQSKDPSAFSPCIANKIQIAYCGSEPLICLVLPKFSLELFKLQTHPLFLYFNL